MFSKNPSGLTLALAAWLVGLVALSALVPGAPQNDEALLALQDGEDACPFKAGVETGSTVPYPASGQMALSKLEAEGMRASLPMDMGGDQLGEVWVSNSDGRAASVLFLGEDGRPRAKAFLRPGDRVKMKLREGAYDARFEAGEDWRGERFGACSARGKVAGIVVAKAGALSKVELSPTSRFVVGNRIDARAALLSEQEAGVRAKPAATEERARARPARVGRDGRPQAMQD